MALIRTHRLQKRRDDSVRFVQVSSMGTAWHRVTARPEDLRRSDVYWPWGAVEGVEGLPSW
jgi:hypothetical protein